MTTEIQQTGQTAADLAPNLAAVASDVDRLMHLLPLLRTSNNAKQEAKQIIEELSAPANTIWLMARIASLLTPYYEKDIPQAIRIIDAEDWAEEFGDAPAWAVQKAARWWKGKDNPNRKRRPVEGDIAERVAFEMDAVRAAKILLNLPMVEQIDEQSRAGPEARKRSAEYLAEVTKGMKA